MTLFCTFETSLPVTVVLDSLWRQAQKRKMRCSPGNDEEKPGVCVHTCVVPALLHVLPVCLVAQQDNQVFGGAQHWQGVRVAFGQAAEP